LGEDDLGPGCKGLKRIFWVVTPNTCQIQSGDPNAPECSSATPAKLRQAVRAMASRRALGHVFQLNYQFKWMEGSGPEFTLATQSQLQAPLTKVPKAWETSSNTEDERQLQCFERRPEITGDCVCSGDGVALSDNVEAINVALRWTETIFVGCTREFITSDT
jgi:hypothetical protein